LKQIEGRIFMKKLVSMALALLLTLSVLTIPAIADENNDDAAVGYLSFLTMTEEDFYARIKAEGLAREYLLKQGVIESTMEKSVYPFQKVIFYDSLDAMLMGLTSGEVTALSVPDCTARYLCTANDQVKQSILYHPEKAEGFAQDLLNRLSNGYSFMMLEENGDLRDQFDQAITEITEDGTLEKLIQTYITDTAESGEPEAIAFEQFEGDPIKVAVTGSLPPMDYVAADGTPAGFNTAVLAEIGKRLGKNIELVQVDSVGRALALAQGNVDVVFWTRGMSEGLVQSGISSISEEEHEAFILEKKRDLADEELAIMEGLDEAIPPSKYVSRDIPEGTITTAPYYTDLNVLVTLK
jgi:ABC-type amino acid transport substrate-binding protein